MTLLCVITCCLFAGQGYDMVLARAFTDARGPGPAGHPGADRARRCHRPGRGSARSRPAGRSSSTRPGATCRWRRAGRVFGLELVIFDGTTFDLFGCPKLAAEFGVPRLGTNPKLRFGLLQAGSMRWKAAALGGYHDGETALGDRLEGGARPRAALPGRPGLLLHGPLAAVLRRRRPPAMAGQERREVRPVPPLRTLKDGSELVLLRESRNMLGTPPQGRRGTPTLPRLPGTARPAVCFTVLTRTRPGRAKTAQVRVLTTLLDPEVPRRREIAALHPKVAGRDRILHLRDLRGPAAPCADAPPSWHARKPGHCSWSTT